MHHVMPGFEVVLQPSRTGLILLIAAVLALLYGLLSESVPFPALLPIPWLVWRALSADGRLDPHQRIRALRILPDGRMQLLIGDEYFLVSVRDNSVAWPWLVVLNLTHAGRRRGLAIFADSANAESRRCLRVYLRWPPGPAIV
jgi:hypothetical protein